MPRITTIKFENGDYRLTGHAGRDLAFAVLNDHYCDNRSCDIQVALNDADCPWERSRSKCSEPLHHLIEVPERVVNARLVVLRVRAFVALGE